MQRFYLFLTLKFRCLFTACLHRFWSQVPQARKWESLEVIYKEERQYYRG